jgi:hypothetical protein
VNKRAILLAVLVVGCSSESSSPPTASGPEADASTVDAPGNTPDVLSDAVDDIVLDALAETLGDTGTVDPFGPYPAGPYGNKVGDVVANLAFEGYVNDLADALSSTKPYGATSMDALRKKAPKGYGLVHVSEFF